VSQNRTALQFLTDSPRSPVTRYTQLNTDVDSIVDVRAVFQEGHRELNIEDMPPLLLPRKGRYGLKDYEKVFCAELNSATNIFDLRGVDRKGGCVIVVRPDQYVAHILPLDAHAEITSFFEGFMLPQN
jgi:hypothetical protein